MRLVLVSLGLAMMLGCERNTTLEVNVTVTADLLASIALDDYPQQVGWGTDLHSGATWAICGPSEDDLVIPLADTAPNCVQEPLDVEVVMGPFVPPSTGCVEERADPFNALATQDVIVATTSGTAFEDASEATCITREETIDVTVGL